MFQISFLRITEEFIVLIYKKTLINHLYNDHKMFSWYKNRFHLFELETILTFFAEQISLSKLFYVFAIRNMSKTIYF